MRAQSLLGGCQRAEWRCHPPHDPKMARRATPGPDHITAAYSRGACRGPAPQSGVREANADPARREARMSRPCAPRLKFQNRVQLTTFGPPGGFSHELFRATFRAMLAAAACEPLARSRPRTYAAPA